MEWEYNKLDLPFICVITGRAVPGPELEAQAGDRVLRYRLLEPFPGGSQLLEISHLLWNTHEQRLTCAP